MKKTTFINPLFAALLILIALSGCTDTRQTDLLKSEIDSLITKWVPDKREGVFTATLDYSNGNYVLRGETNLPEAKNDITSLLRRENISFTDSLLLLPDTSVIKKRWGIVTVSVCNIRSEHSQDAEMVSQSLLGTPVKILKLERGWYLVQTPDLYLGWTEDESVEPVNEEELSAWRSAPRVIYLDKYGDIYADIRGKDFVSDIVAGCILRASGSSNGYREVVLPDGREGFIPSNRCMDFKKWAEVQMADTVNILATAARFMGIPYLWGGTSAKGYDCSGFVKTVYYLNGIVLARDVSLQYRHVMYFPPSAFPLSLEKGDLLFFGTVRNGKTRATHVGIYTGDTEFIHCSGMVRVNSLDSTRANFSRYRYNTFLGAGRIIGQEPGRGRQPLISHNWYF